MKSVKTSLGRVKNRSGAFFYADAMGLESCGSLFEALVSICAEIGVSQR